MTPKRTIRQLPYAQKGAIMEIKIDQNTYRVISNKTLSEADINKVKDTIRLRESQPTNQRTRPTKKFCVVIKKEKTEMEP